VVCGAGLDLVEVTVCATDPDRPAPSFCSPESPVPGFPERAGLHSDSLRSSAAAGRLHRGQVGFSGAGGEWAEVALQAAAHI
jgi:hypothetical protein